MKKEGKYMLEFFIFFLYRTGAIVGSGTDKALEQKLFKLHEELTDLHRKRGEVCYFMIVLVLQKKEGRCICLGFGFPFLI